jgi:hypothetical protein
MCNNEMPPSSPAAGRPREASNLPVRSLTRHSASPDCSCMYPRLQGRAALTHQIATAQPGCCLESCSIRPRADVSRMQCSKMEHKLFVYLGTCSSKPAADVSLRRCATSAAAICVQTWTEGTHACMQFTTKTERRNANDRAL